ncbi:5-Hydroxyisourate Hydrolase (HIUase) [[Actinomadura] parvosata subsp. kistnae]|uniref:5-hydroxyisourate hydrolase n=1 Tax=[Actinomadura] parvosata subsp. kistnae TaxID=1909395 RepID=A0A1V0A3V0_9ACTN|nr:hydroxyisourate hydrolase [Nonomuraea sp. ATCC 55076]AQZ64883.1 hydroxyisourate hydrolase [Nonomuraea sp. ATCC 55076]SPL96099.1 5-Hydroxyisourate Hydrolase (HIUase) [Actinomadura parvosata subsp. kistnae]
MSFSTHVLDAVTGRPAAGLRVRLEHDGRVIAEGRTDDDGRIGGWQPGAGVHRVVFDTGAYLKDTFYPEVVVTFTITDPGRHHHVPLLLSPYAYSTYRGS